MTCIWFENRYLLIIIYRYLILDSERLWLESISYMYFRYVLWYSGNEISIPFQCTHILRYFLVFLSVYPLTNSTHTLQFGSFVDRPVALLSSNSNPNQVCHNISKIIINTFIISSVAEKCESLQPNPQNNLYPSTIKHNTRIPIAVWTKYLINVTRMIYTRIIVKSQTKNNFISTI